MFLARYTLRSRKRPRGSRPAQSEPYRRRQRRLAFQQLEPRDLLSAASLFDQAQLVTLAPLDSSANTGEKPQSKVWQYADHWWNVMPDDSGTWLNRLDDTSWSHVLKLSPDTSAHADVKANGDLAHILLYEGTESQFISVQYEPGTVPSYGLWDLQPDLVDVVLSSGVETATIDLDSTGRLWMASDAKSSVEVRYSDYPYNTFSDPVTIASGITSDDISAITALPDGSVGVLWSNQDTERFGFSVHHDGDPATGWSVDEVPASQSAEVAGDGMADDHLNLAVASDGTLYAAVKTSYDTKGYPKIGLLVRRPSGNWDSLHTVDTSGTRPIVVINEEANRLIVAYTEDESGGNILARESSLDAISFGPIQTLIADDVNNVSSTKSSFTNELVVLATGGGEASGTRLLAGVATDPSPDPDPTPDPEPTPSDSPITVAFQDGLNGYQGTRDTKIKTGNANTNYGTADTLEIDGSPDLAALVRWDLSSIPSGNEILSATLSLNVVNTSSQQYELYELKRDWSEYQATWNNASGSVSWQSAGAQGAEDRGSTVLGSLAADRLGETTIDLNAEGLAVIQHWVNEPGTNFGLVFQDYVNASNGADLSSREDSDSSVRPKLTISYIAGTGSTDPGPDPDPPTTPDPDPDPPTTPEPDPTPVEVSFQDGQAGYSGTRDTTIKTGNPNTNYGTASTLEVDGSPDLAVLIRWDLGTIPISSQILSASITLDVTNTSSQDYEIYELKRSWSEDQATWNNASGTVSWQTAGAQGAADRGSTVLGTISAKSSGQLTIDLNEAGLAVLQSWIDQPGANHGFVFQDYVNASNGADFRSRESSNSSTHPKLTVTYLPQTATTEPEPEPDPSVSSDPDAPAVETSDGLVGWWQFDETSGSVATDTSGLGNHGTLSGNPQRIAGPSGGAIQLDGKGDYAVVPDQPSLDASDSITMALWLRPEQSGTQYVLKKARSGSTDGYELSLSSSGSVFVRFNRESAGNKYRIDSQTDYPVNGNTWMHVAATYDGATIRLYINGRLESSFDAQFQINVNDLDLGIGAEDDGYRSYQGGLDDVRIYNRSLSAEEIAILADQ